MVGSNNRPYKYRTYSVRYDMVRYTDNMYRTLHFPHPPFKFSGFAGLGLLMLHIFMVFRLISVGSVRLGMKTRLTKPKPVDNGNLQKDTNT
jgi:hypothetical protein